MTSLCSGCHLQNARSKRVRFSSLPWLCSDCSPACCMALALPLTLSYAFLLTRQPLRKTESPWRQDVADPRAPPVLFRWARENSSLLYRVCVNELDFATKVGPRVAQPPAGQARVSEWFGCWGSRVVCWRADDKFLWFLLL